MTSANIDLVRSIRAAWERGDYGSVDWADPDIEFVIADGPAPGSWTGVAGMAEGFRSLLNAWEAFHAEADEYRELDGERVLVRGQLSGAWQDERPGARAAADEGSEPVPCSRWQGDATRPLLRR